MRFRLRPGRVGGSTLDIPECVDLEEMAISDVAVLYRARQPAMGRLVGVKVMAEALPDERGRRQVERELAVAERLGSHPNIVPVHRVGFTDDGRAWVVTPWYDGGSLASQLSASGPFDVATALGTAVKVADALAWAHRAGVLHLDIKPENILVSSLGEPALADFGTGAWKAEQLGADQAGLPPTAPAVGTPGRLPVHAAPEVLEGGTPTAASDIWSLGSTLYTALAGRAPFGGAGGDSILNLLLRVVSQGLAPLTRGDVPPSLTGVLERAMAKRPEDRWESAGALAEALRAVQVEVGPAAPRLPTGSSGGEPTVVYERPEEPVAEGDEGGAPPGIEYDRPPDQPPVYERPEGELAPAPPTSPVLPTTISGPGSAPAEAGSTPVPLPPPTPSRAPPPTPSPSGPSPAPPVAGAAPIPRSWKRGAIAAAVAVVVVGILAGVLASSLGQRHRPSPRPTSRTTVTVVDAVAPTGVHIVTDTGSSVTLAWTDPNQGRVAYVVLGGPRSVYQPFRTHAVVTGLDPARRYCFRVAAVVSVTGKLRASPPVCTHRGAGS